MMKKALATLHVQHLVRFQIPVSQSTNTPQCHTGGVPDRQCVHHLSVTLIVTLLRSGLLLLRGALISSAGLDRGRRGDGGGHGLLSLASIVVRGIGSGGGGDVGSNRAGGSSRGGRDVASLIITRIGAIGHNRGGSSDGGARRGGRGSLGDGSQGGCRGSSAGGSGAGRARGRAAGAGARAAEQGGAGDGVLGGLVGVVCDAGIGSLVGTGEGDEVGGRGGATAGDLDLVAARVELGARVAVGRVEGDDLVADEVAAGLDTLGDGVGDAATSGHERGLRRTY